MVYACGTHLCLNGNTWAFYGFNMVGMAAANNCGPTQTDAQINTSLDDQPGAEAVRVWFLEDIISHNKQTTLDWSQFDRVLNLVGRHGKKVVVTLENQWGDCESSGYKNLAWWQSGYKALDGDGPLSYRAFVQAAVNRYKDNTTVAMWQLINEGEARNADNSCSEAAASTAMRAFTDDVGGLVHSLDPNHVVNLGTLSSGRCGLDGGDYKTVHASSGTDMCEHHDYGENTTLIPAALSSDLNDCNSLGKPLFVGETGIKESDAGSRQNRAGQFSAKFFAQFRAGVAGELIWTWNLSGSTASYDVGPGDPVTTTALQPPPDVHPAAAPHSELGSVDPLCSHYVEPRNSRFPR
jgi:endo-1,4-beta-mannosidase